MAFEQEQFSPNPLVAQNTLDILGLNYHGIENAAATLSALATGGANENPVQIDRMGAVLSRFEFAHRDFLERDLRTNLNLVSTTDLSGLSVCIVGGGIAGLLFAKKLSQNGASVTVYEKSLSFGGTWGELAYEGARVDIAGLVYWPSSFGTPTFSNIFPTEREISEQLDQVLSRFPSNVRLLPGHEVTDCQWRPSKWDVTVKPLSDTDDLRPETQAFDWVVLATGRLRASNADINQRLDPLIHYLTPSLRDLEAFSSKSVVIVGNAASATQLAVALHPNVKQLTVVQRTPQWVSFNPMLRSSLGEAHRLLQQQIPAYRAMLRTFYMDRSIRGNLDSYIVDPEWQGTGSVSRENQITQEALLSEIYKNFSGSGIAEDQLTPAYPPGGKRIVMDDGSYPRIFSSGATLVTAARAEAVGQGVRLENGDVLVADATIWATGYRIVNPPFDVSNHSSAPFHLRDAWGTKPEAFLGAMDWRFPNLFFAWGPNTNVVVQGSNTHMMEIQSDLLIDLLAELRRRNSIEARPLERAQDRYMSWVDSTNEMRAWGLKDFSSWYKNANNQVTENFPDDTATYFSFVAEAKSWRDFDFK